MKAVKEQRDKFKALSRDFANRLKLHLLGIFEQYVSTGVVFVRCGERCPEKVGDSLILKNDRELERYKH